MTEQDEADTQPQARRPAPPLSRLTRAGVALILLFILWFVYGQKPRPLPQAPLHHASKADAPEMAAAPAASPAMPESPSALPSASAAPLSSSPESESPPPPSPVAPPVAAVSEEQLEKLQERLKELEGKVNENADTQRLEQMQEQLRKQQALVEELSGKIAALRNQDSTRLSLIAAYLPLKDALIEGRAFREEWQRLSPLVSGGEARSIMDTLQPLADKPAVTLPDLRRDMAKAIPSALEDADKNSLRAHLHSLIRIRKTGEQPGEQAADTDETILARAEARLHEDNVAGALKETEALSPQAAKALQSWQAEAKSYLERKSLAAALQSALLSEQPPRPAPSQDTQP